MGARHSVPLGDVSQQKPGQRGALCFVVDSTGSMSNWLAALNSVLSECVDAAALSSAFRSIGLLAYGDYDSGWPSGPVEWSGWAPVVGDQTPMLALRAAANGLRPRGGGGAPEAFKTAMWRLLDELPPAAEGEDGDHVHVLHLTDAPCHIGDRLDSEGKRELAALGERFPLRALGAALVGCRRVTYSAAVSRSCEPSWPYVALAAATGGEVVVVPDTTVPTLRGMLQRQISAWLGCPATLPLLSPPAAFSPIALPEVDCSTAPAGLRVAAEPRAVAERRELAAALAAAARRVRGDEAFVDEIAPTLARVAATAPMALCANPVLGQMWRAFAARRRDPRRDEFLRALDIAKAKLAPGDAAEFSAWLKASYNVAAEIGADLRAFVRRRGVEGLVRYVGGDEGFVPQSLNEVFLSLDRDAVQQVVAILSRLTVDAAFSLPPDPSCAAPPAPPAAGDAPPPPAAGADAAGASAAAGGGAVADDGAAADFGDGGGGGGEEEGEGAGEPPPLPIPAGSLPANLSDAQLFSLLLHAAVPGLRLSRRPAALLACVAARHGCVLKDRAVRYLDATRGRWINWRWRAAAAGSATAEVPEVAENYSVNFLRLVRSVPAATTAEEKKEVEFLLRVAAVLRVSRMELVGRFPEVDSSDGVRPDHVRECGGCGKARPLSLMTEGGTCGYCVGGDAADVPASDAAGQLQVRCTSCGGYYARNPRVLLRTRSKCHYCRRGTPAPTVACATCALPIVSPSGELPGGVCGPCAGGCAPRALTMAEKPMPVSKLFPLEDTWRQLYAAAGLPALAEPAPSSLPHAARAFRLAAGDAGVGPFPGVDAPAPPPPPQPADGPYRGLANAGELWARVVAAARGGRGGERPMCNLCCEEFDPARLVPLCGRRSCEQRVCGPCGAAWYGRCAPGALVVARSLLCPACARAPSAKTFRRWNPRAPALAAAMAALPAAEVAANHHAWCRVCLLPAACGARTCEAFDAAGVRDFQCEPCEVARVALGGDWESKVPKCPGCRAPTLRRGGCAHMTCTCGAHWCYLCGKGFGAADEVYAHMEVEHPSGEAADDEAAPLEDDFDD